MTRMTVLEVVAPGVLLVILDTNGNPWATNSACLRENFRFEKNTPSPTRLSLCFLSALCLAPSCNFSICKSHTQNLECSCKDKLENESYKYREKEKMNFKKYIDSLMFWQKTEDKKERKKKKKERKGNGERVKKSETESILIEHAIFKMTSQIVNRFSLVLFLSFFF